MFLNQWKNWTRFAVLLLTSFVLSCAHLSPPAGEQDPDQALKKICFNGEGRGQIRVLGQRNSFAFESQLKGQGQWILAINLPLKGEHRLQLPLNWHQLSPAEQAKMVATLKKDFLNTWPAEILNGDLLERFLAQVSLFLWQGQVSNADISQRKCSVHSGQCHFGPQSQWTWVKIENGLEWTQELSEENQLKLALTDENNSHFRELSLGLFAQNRENYLGPLLKLDLHFALCE